MKTLLKSLLIIGLVGPGMQIFAESGHSHGGHKHGGQGEKISVTGEVLDMACYMGHEGKGKKHQKCAEDCILKNHQPIGLLTDNGDVYLLVEDHAKRKPFLSVREKAAETVSLS